MTTHEDIPSREEEPKEVERKFLVDPTTMPDVTELDGKRIVQGYIAINEDGSEERVRDKAGTYTHTFKGDGSLSRTEVEMKISQEEFDELWPQTGGRVVEKMRYDVPHGDRTIELDVYGGRHEGLHVAEVEFPDEAVAGEFEAPEWMTQEVTGVAAYKNQMLALHGLPEA